MNIGTPPALDTRRAVETPEGVSIVLHLAGPLPRALAYAVDVIVRSVILIGLATVLGIFGEVGSGLLLVAIFVAEWFYPVFFEVLGGGRTPGKRWLQLQVLHDDGTPIGWTASVMRNLLRVADFMPLAYGSGLVCSMFHPEFKRLGDIAAGTVVVHRDSESGVHGVPRAASERPSVRLTVPEQHAILQFAERGEKLGAARAAELADHASAITGRRGPESAEALVRLANWLVGRR